MNKNAAQQCVFTDAKKPESHKSCHFEVRGNYTIALL